MLKPGCQRYTPWSDGWQKDQSIDSLLADDEGQDVEQREPVTQLQASNDGQVYGASYATPPPPADILAASVDSIMVDDDMQEQRRNEPGPQVPIDDVMEDLEHSIRTWNITLYFDE